jgi:hypothetical protein
MKTLSFETVSVAVLAGARILLPHVIVLAEVASFWANITSTSPRAPPVRLIVIFVPMFVYLFIVSAAVTIMLCGEEGADVTACVSLSLTSVLELTPPNRAICIVISDWLVIS